MTVRELMALAEKLPPSATVVIREAKKNKAGNYTHAEAGSLVFDRATWGRGRRNAAVITRVGRQTEEVDPTTDRLDVKELS